MALIGQGDTKDCGFYCAYVVSLVNQFGWYNDLPMSQSELDNAMRGSGMSSPLAPQDTLKFLTSLGVLGYAVVTPSSMGNFSALAFKCVLAGKAVIIGSAYHYQAIVGHGTNQGSQYFLTYDPGRPEGGYKEGFYFQHVNTLSVAIMPAFGLV